jgi:hypothetical protein
MSSIKISNGFVVKVHVMAIAATDHAKILRCAKIAYLDGVCENKTLDIIQLFLNSGMFGTNQFNRYDIANRKNSIFDSKY